MFLTVSWGLHAKEVTSDYILVSLQFWKPRALGSNFFFYFCVPKSRGYGKGTGTRELQGGMDEKNVP